MIPGYRRTIEPLRTFGAALANIPANQLERVKTDYAAVDLPLQGDKDIDVIIQFRQKLKQKDVD